MIGNDVIDLELASRESNWKRRGFLDKIFTSTEQELILLAETPEHKVWDLWSRKEAVYKIINRETNERRYNPLAFTCTDAGAIGKTTYKNRVFSTISVYTDSSIHTVSCEDPDTLQRVRSCQRAEITKDSGYPVLQRGAVILPASVSHHGRFIECVYLE